MWCAAVFLDLKKALDKVWYPYLMQKLDPAGLILFFVVKSYLINRTLRVLIDNHISTPRLVTCSTDLMFRIISLA